MLFVMELKTMRRVFLHRHNNAIFIEIIKEKSKKVLTKKGGYANILRQSLMGL